MPETRMIVPEEMLRQKGFEVKIKELQAEKARILADPSLIEWKKKLATTSIDHKIKELEFQNKQREFSEMREGM